MTLGIINVNLVYLKILFLRQSYCTAQKYLEYSHSNYFYHTWMVLLVHFYSWSPFTFNARQTARFNFLLNILVWKKHDGEWMMTELLP